MEEKLKDKEELQDEELSSDNEAPEDKEAWKNNARPVIYAMAGVYLLILAKDLFYAISSSTGTEQILMVVFSILFTVGGLGMVIFGMISVYRRFKKSYDETAERLNKK